jgi:hypothetical protein
MIPNVSTIFSRRRSISTMSGSLRSISKSVVNVYWLARTTYRPGDPLPGSGIRADVCNIDGDEQPAIKNNHTGQILDNLIGASPRC